MQGVELVELKWSGVGPSVKAEGWWGDVHDREGRKHGPRSWRRRGQGRAKRHAGMTGWG
jgi:hypothetical protein